MSVIDGRIRALRSALADEIAAKAAETQQLSRQAAAAARPEPKLTVPLSAYDFNGQRPAAPTLTPSAYQKNAGDMNDAFQARVAQQRDRVNSSFRRRAG